MSSATNMQAIQLQESSSNSFGGSDALSRVQGKSVGLIRGLAFLAASPLFGLVFVIALPLIGIVALPLARFAGPLSSQRRTRHANPHEHQQHAGTERDRGLLVRRQNVGHFAGRIRTLCPRDPGLRVTA